MTQPTPEQLRMARECQKKAYKMAVDDVTTFRDYGVQSALLAIQATEARMAAAVEAERERILVIVADQKKAANESDKWPKYHGMAGSYMQGAYVNACANIEAAIRSATDGQE